MQNPLQAQALSEAAADAQPGAQSDLGRWPSMGLGGLPGNARELKRIDTSNQLESIHCDYQPPSSGW